jgi:hypothetical protein
MFRNKKPFPNESIWSRLRNPPASVRAATRVMLVVGLSTWLTMLVLFYLGVGGLLMWLIASLVGCAALAAHLHWRP